MKRKSAGWAALDLENHAHGLAEHVVNVTRKKKKHILQIFKIFQYSADMCFFLTHPLLIRLTLGYAVFILLSFY